TEDVTESPAVEIDRPLGTDEWYARDEEEIGWNTTAGDGNITSIDLEYSVDGGTSWDTIQEAVEDDGSYVWTVPDEPTEEARVKATVHDDNNLTGEGESELFYIKRDSHELVVDSTDGGDVVEPGEGTFEYNSSEVVDLEAVADDGYQFIEWTGNNATIDEPISNQTAISMEDNYTITAEFASTEVSEVLIYQDTDRVVEAGEELTFDAEAYDQNGNLITDDPTDFTWENATDGVFYETETGDYDVTATYEGVTSNITTVAVEPADAQSIELTPQTTNITAGDSQAFNATAYDEWGNAFDVTDDTSLSDDVDPVDRSYWTDNVITVEEAGDWNIVGEYQNTDGSVSTDEASLTVEPGTFDEVVIYLETDQTVQAGEELLFDAEAYDSYGNLITDNADDFTWENASKGVFYETKTGEYGVTAEYNGVSSRKTTVKVESAEENYVVLTPGINQTITAGETIDFDAEAYDRYDNLVDEDDINFTWQNTDSKGVFTKTTAGDYDVNATYDGVSSAITVVTVEAGRVDQVKITPRADQTITAGETMEFEAEAYDQDNNLITKNRTDFRWENATRGVFNRRRAGEYEVRASYDDVNSTLTTVTVEPSAVQRIEITPEENEVNAGETVSYEVIAFDEYENEIDDVSGNTNWSVDSGAGGSWTGSDYTAENAGEWTVTGDYDGINDTALLTVESGTVNTVELTPSSDQTITSGEQIEFSVLVYDAYGNSLGIDVDDIQWENVTRGVFYHDEAGEYDVSAAYRGIESDVVVVTVEASHELRISPEETSVQESDTVVYEAAVYDIHGKKLEDVTDHAEWSIEPGAGGSWDDNVYTSEKTGNWTVAASHEDLTAEAELKVEVENHGLEWDVNGEGAVETEGQGETYSHGETVELRAVPEEGWYFVGWSGDIKSEEGVIKVTVDRKLNVTANFAKNGTSRFDLEIITIDLEEGVAKIEFVIENIGDFEDRKEVLLTVDGEKEKKIELELEAGAREEEEMIWEPDEEGEHRVRLDCGDDFQVETVHIDDSLSEDSSDDSLDHIYLLLPGIFVIVLILAYVKRSRR
ncbi:MAG: InlB B-repeat-containing protein, partial [Thermoplasmata archaeon]